MNYRDKIKKLLKLTESPNEHEAKAALLKARRLMAEHKIFQSEVEDLSDREVKDILTELTCSKRRDAWINLLANIIAPNYCCQAYMKKPFNKQTSTIGIIGIGEDAEICQKVLTYAVDCVRAYQKTRKEELLRRGWTRKTITKAMEDYGTGFSVGVEDAFEKQSEENESGWGLVMVVPKEVKDYTEGFGVAHLMPGKVLALNEYYEGVNDGKNFDMGSRLQEERKDDKLLGNY